MPTYQYACTECGEQLEVVQKFTDDALTVCPVCQGKLRKLFSAVGIVFKGSGFYRTDSRNGSGGASAAKADGGSTASSGESASKSDSGSGSESKSDSGSGSESKPAAKSEKASSPAPASGTKVA